MQLSSTVFDILSQYFPGVSVDTACWCTFIFLSVCVYALCRAFSNIFK